MAHISEVYASELICRKEGYPLWAPEPEPEKGEVQIGDVGYIHEGRFIKLFNVTVDLGEDVQAAPENYTPLRYEEKYLLEKRENRLESPVYSESTKANRIGLGGEVDAPLPAGGGIYYDWNVAQTKGALLLLPERGADGRKIVPNRIFPAYIKQNYDAWRQFASSKGLAKPSLILARGWVKTDEWTVAAFHSESRAHKGSIKATFFAVGEGKFELSNSHEHHVPITTRSGPRAPSARNPSPVPSSRRVAGPSSLHPNRTHETYASGATTPVDPSRDQCVFLPHYGWKTRFLLVKRLEAQAGPHQLPDRDDDDRDPVIVMDTEAGDETPFEWDNPLDVVLDYILERSDAEVAVACEDDISGLFLDGPWPRDLRAWLGQRTPRIDVEDGVGTLSLEAAINKRRLYDIRKAGRTWQENAMNVDDDALTGPPNPDAPEDLIIGDGSLILGRRQPQGPSMQWYHLSMSDKEAEGGSVSSISLAPNGDRAVTGSDDGYVRLWNVKTGQMLEKWEGHEDNVWSVMYSPDGSKIISGSADAKIIVWDPSLEGGEALVQQLEEHSQDVWAVVYSPDGTKFASGSVDCTVKIWDAESYEVIHTLGGHSPNVMNVGWTPDGKRLVSCADSVGRVWNVENGELLRTLRGHTASIWSMCISKDGERVVTGSEDHTSRIWSTETGDELVTMHEHTGPVWAVAFSPDDREVASGSYDCTVVTNDSFTGERHHVFSGRSSIVDSVAYSANGKYLFSGAADGHVWMWDRERGTMLAEMQGHNDKVKNLVFSKDDRDLYTASEDGSVRVWSLRDIVRVL